MANALKLFPVFAVEDLGAALNFYVDQLGFSIAWQWGQPVHRAGVALGNIEIQLDSESAGATGVSVVYIHMEDVASYYEECRARGTTFLYELDERPWGTRDFRVADPSGNRLGFASELDEH